MFPAGLQWHYDCIWTAKILIGWNCCWPSKGRQWCDASHIWNQGISLCSVRKCFLAFFVQFCSLLFDPALHKQVRKDAPSWNTTEPCQSEGASSCITKHRHSRDLLATTNTGKRPPWMCFKVHFCKKTMLTNKMSKRFCNSRSPPATTTKQIDKKTGQE